MFETIDTKISKDNLPDLKEFNQSLINYGKGNVRYIYGYPLKPMKKN